MKTPSGQPECIWPLAAELGEGPLWWNGALWFTDIKQDRIHRFDPKTRQGKSFEAPSAPGFLAPYPGGPPALVPTGVAVAKSGAIYVSSDIRNAMYKLTPPTP